jgi:hypothetical protein
VIEFDKENKRVVLSRKKALEAEKQSVDSAAHGEIEAYLQSSGGPPTLGEMAGEVQQAEAAKEKKPAAKAKKTAAKKDESHESEDGLPDQAKPAEELKEKKAAKKAAKKPDAGESSEEQQTE